MARQKIPPASQLDSNIISLVDALNLFKGITTLGSCGGHLEPVPSQKPAGEWIVSFRLSSDDHGWRALEFLAWLVNNDSRRSGSKILLEPFSSPPHLNTPGHCLVFHLAGCEGEDPEEFARVLLETKEQCYVRPSSRRKTSR